MDAQDKQDKKTEKFLSILYIHVKELFVKSVLS